MPTPSLFVYGDSISLQYGPFLEAFLADRLLYRRKTGEEAWENLDVPLGANGGDSNQAREYLVPLLTSGQLMPNLLLLNCGLHDIKTEPTTGETQVSLARYRENLTAIFSAAAQSSSRLLWVATTPIDDQQHNDRPIRFHRFDADVRAYNAAALALATVHGISVLDLYTFTRACPPPLYCDHAHFNPHIRQLQAAFLAGALLSFAAKAPQP